MSASPAWIFSATIGASRWAQRRFQCLFIVQQKHAERVEAFVTDSSGSDHVCSPGGLGGRLNASARFRSRLCERGTNVTAASPMCFYPAARNELDRRYAVSGAREPCDTTKKKHSNDLPFRVLLFSAFRDRIHLEM